MTYYGDLTIDEALADPIIQLVMKADRVDAGRLESELRSAAGQLADDTQDDGESDEEAAPKRSFSRSLSDCCQNLAPPSVRYPSFAAIGSRALCGAPCAW